MRSRPHRGFLFLYGLARFAEGEAARAAAGRWLPYLCSVILFEIGSSLVVYMLHPKSIAYLRHYK